jgi:uncharacterized protein
MLIDINKIGTKGLWMQDTIAMDEHLLIEEGSFFLEELDYSIHFIREGAKIKAKGRVQTALSLRCVSCLENFDLKVDSTFDIILFPVQLVDVSHAALSPDEMEYIFFDGEEIDLERILMEQVNLFIPFNPTCSPYCKGICPYCGVNLNFESCQCENSLTGMGVLFDKIKR